MPVSAKQSGPIQTLFWEQCWSRLHPGKYPGIVLIGEEARNHLRGIRQVESAALSFLVRVGQYPMRHSGRMSWQALLPAGRMAGWECCQQSKEPGQGQDGRACAKYICVLGLLSAHKRRLCLNYPKVFNRVNEWRDTTYGSGKCLFAGLMGARNRTGAPGVGEEHCCGARALTTFWNGGLACLPMGLPYFLYMCKTQAREVESESNKGIPEPKADIFWW